MTGAGKGISAAVAGVAVGVLHARQCAAGGVLRDHDPLALPAPRGTTLCEHSGDGLESLRLLDAAAVGAECVAPAREHAVGLARQPLPLAP